MKIYDNLKRELSLAGFIDMKAVRKAVKADLKAQKKLKKAQKRKKQQSAYMRSQQ